MRLAALAAAIGFAANASLAACSEGSVELRGDWGQARFNVELADDPGERAQGLMFRESMPRSAGMLFVYEDERTASFWMRNTYIPLDMVFADGRGVVQKVHENAVPHDTTPIFGGDNIRFVLEINGGLAGQMGISPGSVLRHPAIPQDDAAWPCEP